VCPTCQRPIPAEAFYAEKGAATGVLFYRARCPCGQTVQRVTRPAA
jgi:hypothetical protein